MQIDAKHALPDLVLERADGLEPIDDARVVDQSVDATVMSDRTVDEGLRLGPHGDVTDNCSDLAPCIAHLGNRRREGLGVAIAGHDLRTFPGEQLRHGLAHSQSRARDDDHLALYTHRITRPGNDCRCRT